jgi:hypothetical protein
MGQNQDKTPPAAPAGGARTEAPQDAFDLWLHRSLHDLYDDVTREPIPPELLRLIEEHRARQRK